MFSLARQIFFIPMKDNDMLISRTWGIPCADMLTSQEVSALIDIMSTRLNRNFFGRMIEINHHWFW